jgi:MFS family permease
LNRNLVFIAVALLLWGFGEGMFFNFQPIYLKSLGSDEQQIGLILGAFGAAMAVTHIPAGRLADRIGRRPLIWAAWVMGLVSTVVMALARELPLFVVGNAGLRADRLRLVAVEQLRDRGARQMARRHGALP